LPGIPAEKSLDVDKDFGIRLLEQKFNDLGSQVRRGPGEVAFEDFIFIFRQLFVFDRIKRCCTNIG